MVRGNVFFTLLIIFMLNLSFSPVTAAQKPQVTVDIKPSKDVMVDRNGDFHVPLRTRVHWTVDVTIVNPENNPDTFQHLIWSNNYDSALAIVSATAERGLVKYAPAPPSTQITWAIDALAPGESTSLRFQLATRVNGAGEPLYRTVGCDAWESGAILHYGVAARDHSYTAKMPARQRCVQEAPPWLQFSVTSLKDWRLLGPICSVSEAARTRVEVASNDLVSVMFETFGNPQSLESPFSPPIPTYYARGDNLFQIGYGEFLPTGSLNGTVWTFGPASAPEAGITKTLWTQICIGSERRPADYQDDGVITITLHGGSMYVDKP